jgi:glycosyltransferase involved in cell wall biosynthesis
MIAEFRLPISVCLIAGNEAHRICRALDSVQGWTSEIILAIDDRVTDGTDKIAQSYGAKIISQPWRSHAAHRNFASTHATQQIPPDFGLLTIDAECMDLEVLQGLDFSRWRPRIIITEDYMPKFPAKSELLKKNGYQLRTQIAGNSIWTAGEITPLPALAAAHTSRL